MKDNKLPTRSVVLTPKTQVLEALRKVRLKLLWCFWGFVAVFLIGFALSFWLTQKDERWTSTFENLQDNNWDFFSITMQLSKNSTFFWLGSQENFLVFILLVCLPLSVNGPIFKSWMLVKMLFKIVQENSELFDLTIVKAKTTRNFYFGMSFFLFLNFFGYTCKVIEEIKQDPKKQKEISSEEIVAGIVRSSSRKSLGFLLLFLLFRVLSLPFFYSFSGIVVFLFFRSLNYFFKIFLMLVLWLLLETFVFWLLTMRIMYLWFWVGAKKIQNICCTPDTVCMPTSILWDELLWEKQSKPVLPITLVFRKR